MLLAVLEQLEGIFNNQEIKNKKRIPRPRLSM